MKIYPYINTDTGEPVAPRAQIRVPLALTYRDLINLLAANAPHKDAVGDRIAWEDGEQADDVGERRAMQLIYDQIEYGGAGEYSGLWAERVSSGAADFIESWAVRQVNRLWGADFEAAGQKLAQP